jgi:hypothetical protein
MPDRPPRGIGSIRDPPFSSPTTTAVRAQILAKTGRLSQWCLRDSGPRTRNCSTLRIVRDVKIVHKACQNDFLAITDGLSRFCPKVRQIRVSAPTSPATLPHTANPCSIAHLVRMPAMFVKQVFDLEMQSGPKPGYDFKRELLIHQKLSTRALSSGLVCYSPSTLPSILHRD